MFVVFFSIFIVVLKYCIVLYCIEITGEVGNMSNLSTECPVPIEAKGGAKRFNCFDGLREKLLQLRGDV